MKQADAYRSARRNHLRDTPHPAKGFKWAAVWRSNNPWMAANMAAKLGERQKTCAAANRAVLLLKIRRLASKLADAEINQTLLKFWRKQPYTRVNYRIVRELERQHLTLAKG